MLNKEYYYDWHVDLNSSQEGLWPFIADTNRFNRDTGLPAIEHLTEANKLTPGKYRLRFYILGQRVEWDEAPFDWVYPFRFGVIRDYVAGPVKQMRVLAEMTPNENGGTHLRYQVWARPANLLGHAAIPVQIGLISANQFKSLFKKYDELVQTNGGHFNIPGRVKFARGGYLRLETFSTQDSLNGNPAVAQKLRGLLEYADELALQRLRPFQLADLWQLPRRDVLETFLRATKAGILDIRWELLCPGCRGASESHGSLSDVHNGSHCNYCNMDFDVDFDRQVEVIFRPNPAVRPIPESLKYCINGPQSAPHLPINQLLAAGDQFETNATLQPGYYGLGVSNEYKSLNFFVDESGQPEAELKLTKEGWQVSTQTVKPQARFRLINQTLFPQRIQLEKTAWQEDAATAVDVTSLQVFRNLFSREALRAGEEISVGHVTLMFTDLRDSTRMYRQLGDGPAFGRVRQHFDLLENAIAANNGAIIKTIGDAVMAVFRQPVDALKATQAAHEAIEASGGSPELYLKVGIHNGPCIAVNLNERLDYFGSTVNLTARLPGLSQGGEVIFSETIYADVEVQNWLRDNRSSLSNFQDRVKGYDEPIKLYRLKL